MGLSPIYLSPSLPPWSPALIYFVVADLASIDPMYQYSLTYFAKLYNTCIDDAEKSTNLDKRLASLM